MLTDVTAMAGSCRSQQVRHRKAVMCAARHFGDARVLLLGIILCLASSMVSGQPDHEDSRALIQQMFHFTKSAYNATIMENSVAKTYVTPSEKMGMFVVDPTLDIRYRVTGGDRNKLFKADERIIGDFCFLRIRTRSGMQKTINRESQEKMTLTIKAVARYKNGPSLSAFSEVTIHVQDANDAFPLFSQLSYTLDLPENAPLHQSVYQVSASDADIGVNGEIYHSFEKRTEYFAIHPTSGVITVTRPLSYTKQNTYELDIIGKDRGPVFGMGVVMARAKLLVHLTEVNFFSPVIDVQELPAVVEQGQVGTVYAILYVHDKDDGINGQIDSVHIQSGDPDGYFQLRSSRRQTEFTITVAKVLDREEYPDGFNLTIFAQDNGNPPKNVTRVVHVLLSDTNDNAPKFENIEYKVSVNESVPLFTPLTFVKAADTDVGKNSEIVYSIIAGNDLGWFAINPLTGLVIVAGPLDAERSTNTVLTITAQDRANSGARKSSSTTLSVSIVDCNDNAPIFNHSTNSFDVDENTPVGSEVFRVSAYDRDQGDNGYISFSIANVNSVPFIIDPFSGIISTIEDIDYETQKRTYSLLIRASDWGSPYRRETEGVVTVRVRDVNDNQPQFEGIDCSGYLSREAPVGTKLVVVSAIDFDAGNIISYSVSKKKKVPTATLR